MWTTLPTIHLAVADAAPSMVEVEVKVSVDVLEFHGRGVTNMWPYFVYWPSDTSDFTYNCSRWIGSGIVSSFD